MRTAPCVLAILLAFALMSARSRADAACGDGVRDGTEQCDGADLGGETCFSVTGGFVHGGTLACNADCTFDMTGCRTAFIDTLVPARGGAVKNRCQMEWTIVGTQGTSTRRACTDGDGGCDEDHSFDNTCTLRLQVCLNVPDQRVAGCPFVSGAPGKVITVAVLAPQSQPDIIQGVMNALTDLARGANIASTQGASDVGFTPPVTTFACGQGTIKIPLRGTTGHARPGKVKIRARSSDNSGKIRAIGQLQVTCMP